MKKVKIECIKRFSDVQSDTIREVGEVWDEAEMRAKELETKGFVRLATKEDKKDV